MIELPENCNTLSQLYCMLFARKLHLKRVIDVPANEQTELWRLKQAGYLVEHKGVIYETSI